MTADDPIRRAGARAIPRLGRLAAWLRRPPPQSRPPDLGPLFDGLFDASPDALFVHRVAGPASFPLEALNGVAAEVLKTPREAAVGRELTSLLHPTNVDVVQAELCAACAEGAPRTFGLQAHPDRSHRAWQLTITPLKGEDGAVVRLLTAARDVTELKAAETAARQAAAIKAEFLANMSHEIRTPLNTIIGFSGLLCERDLPAEEARWSRLVNSASHALLSIVDDVLDFSKLEAGVVTLDPAPFDLDRLAHEAVELFEGQAEDRGLTLSLRLEGERLPPVVGDGGRVRQILLNLISNALKFTEEGSVALTVRRERSGGVARVAFLVADTGIGIPPGKLGRLFQRFTQLDGGGARRYGGAGLGLAICRRLAEAMDAELTVESAVGAGSTFSLAMTLPLAPGAAAEPAPPPPADRRPRHVLVVDDIDVNRELVAAFLKSTPHRVSVASGGREAVEAVQREAFDLVFMDIQMPGMTGVEATQAIRALGGGFARLPILAMTANALPAQVAGYMAAGMDGHLPKPLLKENVLAAIDRFGDGRPRAEEPPPWRSKPKPLAGMAAGEIDTLLQMFDGQLARRLNGPDADREAIRIDAHALAGSSAMVGFDVLGEACRRLDEACRSGGDYAAPLAEARRELAAARAAIAERLAA